MFSTAHGKNPFAFLMVRLKDVAQRARTSLMTASRALREEPDVAEATRARVKLAAAQLGYVPNSAARDLRTRRSKLVGLVVSSLTNPIFARMVLAVEGRSHELGYDVLLAHTLNDPAREEVAIRRLIGRGVDGLFISPVYRLGSDAPVYREILARKIPTVILGHIVPFYQGFVNVESDDLLGGYAATHHLLELGHRRIAFFAGPPATPWTQERFEGYRRALREQNLDVDDKLVFQAGRTIEDGRKAAMQMINEGSDATAVQGINDMVAAGCAQEFLKQGLRIPDDVSVTGFGNTLLSEYFRVPLTTVRQPKFRLGSAAFDSMLELLGGKTPEPRRLLAELAIRSSTGTTPATPRLAQMKAPTEK